MNRARAIRVLICDDARDYRYLLRAILDASPGIELVGEASNGREGVARATELQPDVVLLDLSMPGVDGWEALPLIRAGAPDARVLVVSAFDPGDFAAKSEALGAHAYLDKSVALEEVADAILAAGPTS